MAGKFNLKVSVIIPCRNEEKMIAKCLNSLVMQNYSHDRLEILVVTGDSKDRTREIVDNYSKQYHFIKILDNPDIYTSYAFNLGIRKSIGEVVIFMGAHAAYDRDYIGKCVRYIDDYDANCVGGTVKIISAENTLIGKAIALSISSPFGAGNAHYKVGRFDGPQKVDTVFGGCYKKKIFDKIGFFNEKLHRSQDMELNIRLKKAGGVILLFPDIVTYYYPKSNLKDFFVHNISDGIWAIYPLKFVNLPMKLRHYIPLVFVLTLFGALLLGIFIPFFFYLFLFVAAAYFLISLYFSITVFLKEKNYKYLIVMPVVFAVRHIGYGFGSLCGLIKLLK